MLSRVLARGERIAVAAQARAVARVAEAADAVPGVRAEAGTDGVAVRGRGLRRRWLTDARLRWIGGWL